MRRIRTRIRAAALAVLASAGCLGGPSAIVQTPPVSEATTQASLRVETVGGKLISANPGIGCKPVFRTIGAQSIELFHTPSGEFTLICITEGLVARCASDAQLAAVLASELARVANEKEMLARAGARPEGYRPPPDAMVGREGDGDGVTADRTRLAELAKDQRAWRQTHPEAGAVDVPALTRSYLQAAGHPPELADAVPALTRGMTTRNSFERLFTGGGLRW